MNLYTIVKPNAKGQIVIPKKFRVKLGIDEDVLLNISLKAGGVYITPLNTSIPSADSRNITLQVLRQTAGSWSGDDWEKTERRRKEIELDSSKKRKSTW